MTGRAAGRPKYASDKDLRQSPEINPKYPLKIALAYGIMLAFVPIVARTAWCYDCDEEIMVVEKE